MDRKALRVRCEARLRELCLPHPFDVLLFCRTLGEQRQRPIRLHPVANLEEFTGLWIAGSQADHIYFECDTSRLHQELIILHEVSHLLLGHRPMEVTESDLSAFLFPHIEPETVRRVLRRATYSRREEQEAELLATLILERADRPPEPGQSPGDPITAQLVSQLETLFNQPGA